MIKKYKNYIIFAVIIIILLGAYILISSFENEPSELSKVESTTVTVYDIPADDIASVSINNEYGEYTFLFGENITVKGKEKIDLDKEIAENLKIEFSTVTAESIVKENADNLFDFGLDNPKISAVITDVSGKAVKLYLGDKSPVGNGYYMKKDDENTVYILPQYKCNVILRKLDHYRNTVLMSVVADNVTKISYEKKGGNKVAFERYEVIDTEAPNNYFSAFHMTEPYQWDAEGTEVSKVIESLVNFAIADYVEDNPQDIIKYGFNPYSAKISVIQNDGNNYELLLGNNVDGKFYVMLKGRSEVYTVNASGFSYLDMEPNAYLQTFAYIKNIDTIKKIVYNHNDSVKAEFEIKKIKDEEHDIKFRGRNVSQSIFKELYTELISITIGGSVSFNPDKPPVLTYEFYFNDGSRDTISYYEYDERKLALSVNGKIQFYVNKAEFESRIKSVDNIINNKF